MIVMAARAIAPFVDKAEPPQSIESEQGREHRPSLFCAYEAARLTNETPRPAETTARPDTTKR